METAVGLEPEPERRLAAELVNQTWRLLDMESRTAEQDDEMLHCAHASRYHWGRVGQPVNLARGEWQISRVYSVLGRGNPPPFMRVGVLTTLVRGQRAEAEHFAEEARRAGAGISDAEDFQILSADLATLRL